MRCIDHLLQCSRVALMAQFLPNRSPRYLREWMRTGSIKNFSRAMEEAQEMLQLISGQSNARLYKGAGVELSFKTM